MLAQPDTVGYRARKFVSRNRLAVTAAAVFSSCIVAFGLVATVQARALAEQSRVASLERDKAEQVVRVLVDLFETTNPAVRPGGDRMTVREFLTGAEGRALAQLRSTPPVKKRSCRRSSVSSTTNAASWRWRATLSRKPWQSSGAWLGPIGRTRSSPCTRSGALCMTQATSHGPAVFSRSPSTVIVMPMATSTRRLRERCFCPCSSRRR